MSERACNCPAPMLTVEGSLIRCQMCGDYPREDLGGSDDLARIRYRVSLNRLRERMEAEAPERPKEGRAGRIEQAQFLRSQGRYIREIAEAMGCRIKTVRHYLYPDEYAAHLEANKARKPAWNAANADRRREYGRTYMRSYRARKAA